MQNKTLESLTQASGLVLQARSKTLTTPWPVQEFLIHVQNYLDDQVDAEMRGED